MVSVGQDVDAMLAPETIVKTLPTGQVKLPDNDLAQNVPLHALALTETQQKHAVTFRMPRAKIFGLSISNSSVIPGHTIMFAGPSNVVCPTRALCSSFSCPAGFVAKSPSRVY